MEKTPITNFYFQEIKEHIIAYYNNPNEDAFENIIFQADRICKEIYKKGLCRDNYKWDDLINDVTDFISANLHFTLLFKGGDILEQRIQKESFLQEAI